MTKGRFDTFTVGISCSHPPPLQIISFFSAATRGGVCSFKWQKFCASQLPRVLISDLQKLVFDQDAKNGSHKLCKRWRWRGSAVRQLERIYISTAGHFFLISAAVTSSPGKALISSILTILLICPVISCWHLSNAIARTKCTCQTVCSYSNSP